MDQRSNRSITIEALSLIRFLRSFSVLVFLLGFLFFIVKMSMSLKRRRVYATQQKSIVPVSAKQAESNLAARVVKLAKLVRGLKPEVKYIDVSLATTNAATAGTVIHLTPISQGTAVNTRVGDVVRMLWYQVNLNILFTSSVMTTVTENPAFRFYIVQDRQQGADTAPTLAQLVDNPALPSYQLLEIQSAMQGRFKVLYDSKPQLMAAGTIAVADLDSSISFPARFQFNFQRNFKSQINFNGAASTDIQRGGIYFMFSTNMVDVGAAACVDFVGTTRIAYTDV